MKIAKLLSLVALILITASLASAQVTVDPNDDGCWQSLSSLRACQIAQQQLVTAQAASCTSFPEYQCIPEPEAAPQHTQAKKQSRAVTQGVTAFQTHERVSASSRGNPDVAGREAEVVGSPR